MAANNTTAEYETVQLQDLVTSEAVAINKWPIIVDRLGLAPIDTARIKPLLALGGTTCAQAVLDSLQIWKAAGGHLLGLIDILRQQLLNGLADKIIDKWPAAVTNTVSIMQLGPRNTFQIVIETLNDILGKVGSRSLVIYSINGKMRSGKSFMLNQFLKYLQFGSAHPGNWIEQTLSKAFIWRGGTQRVTAGIQIWSDVFPIRKPDGSEVAVLLLDVQGLFDDQTSTRNDALLFAFSTLLSSVNIFNVKSTLGGDTFQFWQTFLECARLSVSEDDGNSGVFQKLILLLRDYADEAEYGFGLHDDRTCPTNKEGDKRNLKRHHFDNLDGLSGEARRARETICACYDDISVLTLPNPGTGLAENSNGEPSSWDTRFKKHVTEFVEDLFSPDAVQANIKRAGGEEMTGDTMVDYVAALAKLCTDPNHIPEVKSVLEAAVEIQGTKNVQKSVRLYENGVDQLVRDNPPGILEDTFESGHESFKAASIEAFQATRALGGHQFAASFLEQLIQEIDSLHTRYRNLNGNNLAATFEKQAKQNVQDNTQLYENAIDKLVRDHPKGLPEASFTTSHQSFKASSVSALEAARGIGDKQFPESFLQQLTQEIDRIHAHYQDLNANNLKTAADRDAAKALAVHNARVHLEEARRSLDAARGRLTAVHQNRDSFHDVEMVRTKHKTRFLGFNSTPYYTNDAVKVFNQAKFDQAVAVAEQDVRNDEARVQKALNALTEAERQ